MGGRAEKNHSFYSDCPFNLEHRRHEVGEQEFPGAKDQRKDWQMQGWTSANWVPCEYQYEYNFANIPRNDQIFAFQQNDYTGLFSGRVLLYQPKDIGSDMYHYGFPDGKLYADHCSGSACGSDVSEHNGIPRAGYQTSAKWDSHTGRIINGVKLHTKLPEKPKRKPRDERKPSQMILAASLASLADTDCRRVIHASQIQKLGLRSDEALRAHCEQFGPVTNVLLSNKHVKSPDSPEFVRIRPSGIAFIVMENIEDAAKILAGGETLVVEGTAIKIRQFEAMEKREREKGQKLQFREVERKVLWLGRSSISIDSSAC